MSDLDRDAIKVDAKKWAELHRLNVNQREGAKRVGALLAALEEAERERDEALAVIDKTLDNIDPESEYENPGVPQWTHAEVREMLQSIRAALHPVAETTEGMETP